MWLKADNTDPAFHYTVAEHKGKTVLIDEVTYLKKEKEKAIKGIDRQDAYNPNTFTWGAEKVCSDR